MNKLNYLLTSLSIFALPSAVSKDINNNIIEAQTVLKSDYHQVYVLGDSLSDTGGFVGVGTDFVKNNWLLPHLSKIQLGSPFFKNSSFSNGPVASQILANKLNFDLTPGWDFSILWDRFHYNHVGNNYAVGGAVAGKNNSWTGECYSNRFSVSKQLDALLKQHTLESNDLVLVATGNNDMFAALDSDSVSEQFDIVNNAIAATVNVIKRLVDEGVQHIIVTDAPDFSLVPKYHNTKKEESAKVLSSFYNNKWSKEIKKYKEKYSNIIKEYNLSVAFNKCLNDFKNKGLNTTQSAISTSFLSLITKGEVKTEFVNGANENNLNEYFFLDEVHPTEYVHQFVGNDLYNLVKNW